MKKAAPLFRRIPFCDRESRPQPTLAKRKVASEMGGKTGLMESTFRKNRATFRGARHEWYAQVAELAARPPPSLRNSASREDFRVNGEMGNLRARKERRPGAATVRHAKLEEQAAGRADPGRTEDASADKDSKTHDASCAGAAKQSNAITAPPPGKSGSLPTGLKENATRPRCGNREGGPWRRPPSEIPSLDNGPIGGRRLARTEFYVKLQGDTIIVVDVAGATPTSFLPRVEGATPRVGVDLVGGTAELRRSVSPRPRELVESPALSETRTAATRNFQA